MKKFIFFILVFFLCETGSGEIISGRIYAGYGLITAKGEYYNANQFVKDKMIPGGFNIGFGMSFNSFSEKNNHRFGFSGEYFSLGYTQKYTIGLNVQCWSLSVIYEYHFLEPKKKALVPFIITGPSLIMYKIYFNPDITVYPEAAGLFRMDRHFKFGWILGVGLNYYLTDKFGLEFIFRGIYIPADNHLIYCTLTGGFSVIF